MREAKMTSLRPIIWRFTWLVNSILRHVSLTAAALLAGVIGFTAFLHSQAHAETAAVASSVRCFMGNKMDRPSTQMTRGWVCVSERAPVAIN